MCHPDYRRRKRVDPGVPGCGGFILKHVIAKIGNVDGTFQAPTQNNSDAVIILPAGQTLSPGSFAAVSVPATPGTPYTEAARFLVSVEHIDMATTSGGAGIR